MELSETWTPFSPNLPCSKANDFIRVGTSHRLIHRAGEAWTVRNGSELTPTKPQKTTVSHALPIKSHEIPLYPSPV